MKSGFTRSNLNSQNLRGFTMIELLVVIAILTVISLAGVNTITEFQRQAILTSASRELGSTLRLAQTKSMAGELKPGETASTFASGGLPYFAVSLNGSSYVLERIFTASGSVSPTTETLETHTVDPSVSVAPSNFVISFSRITGVPPSGQTITLTRINSNATNTITVGANGTIIL